MLTGYRGSSQGVSSRDQHHSLCTEAPPQAAGAFHPQKHVAVIFPLFCGFSVVIHTRQALCVCRESPGAEARIRAAGQGNGTLDAAGSTAGRRPPLSEHDLPCPAQPGACRDLAKHHAGTPWDQTGTGERAGVREGETLHDRGRLGLHWGAGGRSRVTEGCREQKKNSPTQQTKQNNALVTETLKVQERV